MITQRSIAIDHVVRELRAVFKLLDDATEKALAYVAERDGHVTSCGGCKTAGCCYQLTTISFPEGLALADALLSDARHGYWRDLVPQLVRVAIEDTRPGLTRSSRMRAAVPCALLDLSGPSARCVAYDSRPGCCRFHNAVTPEVHCHPDAERLGLSTKTGSIDLTEIEGALWEVTATMARDMGVGPTDQAPVSLMTLACLMIVLDARDDADGFSFISHAVEHLPSPETWMMDHAIELHAEETRHSANDAATAAHNAKLVQIAKRVFEKTGL